MRQRRTTPQRAGSAAAADPIWAWLARQRRGRPALDHDRIVRAAMALADGAGLEAVSMRHLAGQVGAGTMSLYRHVSRKEDLFDLMFDAAFAEIELPASPSGDWQADLRRLARQTRRTLRAHPWLGSLLTSRPTFGPHYLGWFDWALGSVSAAGVDLPTAVRVIGTLYAYVSGVAAYEAGEAETNRRHGLTEERKRAAAAPYLDTILATGRYPNLARFVRHGSGEPSEADFEFGLGCVLAGLAAAVEGCRRPPFRPKHRGSPR